MIISLYGKILNPILLTDKIKKTSLRMLIGYLERVKRIELSQSAWKAEVLPLNYTRILFGLATSYSRTCVLPSALRSLTSVFGMGTGVPSLPLSLDLVRFLNLTKLDTFFFFSFRLSARWISISPLHLSPNFHS